MHMVTTGCCDELPWSSTAKRFWRVFRGKALWYDVADIASAILKVENLAQIVREHTSAWGAACSRSPAAFMKPFQAWCV